MITLSDIPTKELVEELSKREGVEKHIVLPNGRDYIYIDKLPMKAGETAPVAFMKNAKEEDWEYVYDYQKYGPAIILRVID